MPREVADGWTLVGEEEASWLRTATQMRVSRDPHPHEVLTHGNSCDPSNSSAHCKLFTTYPVYAFPCVITPTILGFPISQARSRWSPVAEGLAPGEEKHTLL